LADDLAEKGFVPVTDFFSLVSLDDASANGCQHRSDNCFRDAAIGIGRRAGFPV
jgi:hypothetical protein